ncbi:MAG: acyltransferase family protein [Pseudolabrys sp.]
MLVYIQILRFAAALAVVAFHAWGIAPRVITVPADTPTLGLWQAGQGVDLFFVISGFIIYYATTAHAARGKPLAPAAFLRRRVERIVPLYFFAIAIVTLLALVLPEIFDTPGWYTPNHVLKSLAFISFTDGEMPVVFVGWSLEYEMYFYLVVALLMALTQHVWRNIVLLFSALAIIGQIPGVASTLGHYGFFTDSLILEFIFGVMVGVVFVHGRRANDVNGRIMLFAATAAVVVLAVTDTSNRALVFGLPSAALVAAAAWINRKRTAATWPERALERLGDASFSIYLAQVNTVIFAAQAVAYMIPTIHPLLLVAATSVIVVAAGLALNIAVERPLLKVCRNIGRDAAASRRPMLTQA